jgi:DNA repair protein RadC
MMVKVQNNDVHGEGLLAQSPPMKPGRRLIEEGAERCGDLDLLAILLGTGIPGRSAEQIAHDILDRYGTLGGLMGRPLRELAEIRGVGPVKAIRIAATYELTRRVLKELEVNT